MCAHSIIFVTFICLTLTHVIATESLIDLTYTVNNYDTPTYPIAKRFHSVPSNGNGGNFDPRATLIFYLNDFTMGEHSGTHIDAPRHVGEQLSSVSEMPLDSMYKIPGIVIDVAKQVKSDHNYAISAEDIEDWIEEHGSIPDGSIIIFRTGWGKRALDPKIYFGYDSDGKMNFPGIGADAAEWIVNYKNSSSSLTKGIIAVAVDVVSLDTAKDFMTPAHEIILPSGIYGIENIANIQKLPARDFIITMLPMKIGGGTGSPIRIIAEIGGIPNTSIDSAAPAPSISHYSTLMQILFVLFCSFLLA